MSEEKEDIVDIVIRDAKNNHHVEINDPNDINDSNLKTLVAYAISVGVSMGYREYKHIMELKEKKD